jgi:hypothetical protein
MKPGQIPILLSTGRTSKMTLEERYADNPDLLSFYRKKLLEPGWAGELDSVELAYIKSELRQSASLRRKWGFKPSARRLSEKHIRVVARDGLSVNKRLVLASVVGKQKSFR